MVEYEKWNADLHVADSKGGSNGHPRNGTENDGQKAVSKHIRASETEQQETMMCREKLIAEQASNSTSGTTAEEEI